MLAKLATHVEGKAPEDLVFTGIRGGGPLRAAIFRRGHFDAAAKAIGLPGLHPHELRHTAASLAIAFPCLTRADAQDPLLAVAPVLPEGEITHVGDYRGKRNTAGQRPNSREYPR